MAEMAAEGLNRSLEREEAFGRLVSRELASAYRTATALLRDPAEAEDATQEALVRAWQRWDALRDGERAGAWFGRILVNVCGNDHVKWPHRDHQSWPHPRRCGDVLTGC